MTQNQGQKPSKESELHLKCAASNLLFQRFGIKARAAGEERETGMRCVSLSERQTANKYPTPSKVS